MSLQTPDRLAEPGALTRYSPSSTDGGETQMLPWHWCVLLAWLLVDLVAVVVLGPVMRLVVIGGLGVMGAIAFCDWWRWSASPNSRVPDGAT